MNLREDLSAPPQTASLRLELAVPTQTGHPTAEIGCREAVAIADLPRPVHSAWHRRRTSATSRYMNFSADITSCVRWQLALDAADSWLTDLSTGPARRRLLLLLLRLSEHTGSDSVIWLPRREEIGAMLDLTVETASRQIAALRREGLLELRPMQSAVLDKGALHRALRVQGAA